MGADHSTVSWRRSSYCGTGACVEVAGLDASVVFVRDAKEDNGPALAFGSVEWSDFLVGVKSGHFDA